jgi:capsular polysaccharide transport system permease protein
MIPWPVTLGVRYSDALPAFRPQGDPLGVSGMVMQDESDPAVTVQTLQRRRPSVVRVLFVLVVLVPTLLTLAYALTTRSPFYVSQVQFAIEDRSQTSLQGATSAMASIGLMSGQTDSMYSLRRFLQSRDALAELEQVHGFKRYYTSDQGDWLTALSAGANLDKTMQYYQRVVTPHISTTENILTLEVWAYDPEVAQGISRALLQISENFLNRINARSLDDQLAFYKRELDVATKILAQSRAALTTWRNNNNALDPMVQAQMIQGLISALEGELSNVRADISQILNSENPERLQPRIRALQERENSLLLQISETRNRLTGASDDTVALQISSYEELNANVELAQSSVSQLMVALDSARQATLQQQKYLLLISSPSLNHERVFPRPWFHTLVVAAAAMLIFGVLTLLHTILRDYRSV